MKRLLSKRECEVVAELARDGANNRVIGQRLFIQEQTVKFHLGNAMTLIGCENRTALALWWVRYGQYMHAQTMAEPEPVEAA